jgi:predicted RNA binding protein YcfA (HicA-like mRNA interferase family)
MRRYSATKEINVMAHELVRDGWRPVRRKKHWQLVSPDGFVQTVPGSSGDFRAVAKFKNDIRRAERVPSRMKGGGHEL